RVPAEPLAERLDDVLALLQGADLETHDRAAILLGDRHVLRDVHEAARQITRVGGLARRIRQPPAGALRRRVRYPASACVAAVSAGPLRAPWVDVKCSSGERPSRKFDLIGLSMISP